MLLLIALTACMLGAAQLAHADLEGAQVHDHVKHIFLNNTHLIEVGEKNYAIINPMWNMLFAVTVNGDSLEISDTRENIGQDQQESHKRMLREQAKNIRSILLGLSMDWSSVGPKLPFVSVEYPVNGSAPRVIAKVNCNSMVVKNDGTVLYDATQYSAAKMSDEHMLLDQRISLLSNFIVTTRTHEDRPIVKCVHFNMLDSTAQSQIKNLTATIYQ